MSELVDIKNLQNISGLDPNKPCVLTMTPDGLTWVNVETCDGGGVDLCTCDISVLTQSGCKCGGK